MLSQMCPYVMHHVSTFSFACFAQIKKQEPFWPLVNVSVDLDLSEFGLPDDKRFLNFEFIDPVWAWVRAAFKQPATEMQWVPKVQCVRGLENHVLVTVEDYNLERHSLRIVAHVRVEHNRC